MQFKNSLCKATLIKIFKGGLIAGGGAMAYYLLIAFSGLDYGVYTPTVVASFGILINIVKEWRSGK